MIERIALTSGWTLRPASPEGVPDAIVSAMPIAANVPGVVHTDLLAAGLIPDPYSDRNELDLGWIGRVDWIYETVLPVGAASDHVELEFDGLDTVATVTVGDVVVARTENMHRRYRVPIAPAVGEGRATLAVRFDSALRFAEDEAARLGDLPRQYPMPFNFIRKSACNFGWDWGPAFVGAGIWREARLVTWSGARIAEVRPRTTVADSVGHVEFEVILAGSSPDPLAVRAEVDGVVVEAVVAPGADRAVVHVEVANPDLWWPRGFGNQPLSAVLVTLLDATGSEVDVWRDRVGFRTVELDVSADDGGSQFQLRVNGLPVPVRGVNWIPDDCFFPRVTPERVRRRIGQATDAGLNLLRIWGGGTYESDDFYRICDEEGVLVWQDFLFACAAYPEEERLAREVEEEARDNVARLLPHPSLVLWNGNNENIWGEQDWDWRPGIGGRQWGLGYYLGLLPRVIAETDPHRPYWPGSPYSGSLDVHPNDDDHGTKHIWDVWNRVDYAVYRDYRPRFVAEFGWQAPPTWSTLTRSIHDDPLTPDSPGMRHHQKADDGIAKLANGIARHFPEPANLDDWHYAAQLTQARAVRVGIEWYRSLRPRCTGTILWQLNDCWPVTSWAVVDGDERLKPAWYALRAASRSRLLTFQPTIGDGLELVAVNDDPTPWAAEVVVRRITVTGEVRYEQRVSLVLAGLGVERMPVPVPLAETGDPARELLVAEIPGEPRARALWWFADDRGIADPDEALRSEVVRDGADAILTLTAEVITRDIVVLADRVHPAAEADDAVFTLLAGETRHVRVTGIPDGLEVALTAAPVLRHAAQLLANSQEVDRP